MMDSRSTPPPVETQSLFKPIRKPDVNPDNVKNALNQLKKMNEHFYESFIRHCENTHCTMSFPAIKFVSQTFPLLCLRSGQVPPDVRKLVLESVKCEQNKITPHF